MKKMNFKYLILLAVMARCNLISAANPNSAPTQLNMDLLPKLQRLEDLSDSYKKIGVGLKVAACCTCATLAISNATPCQMITGPAFLCLPGSFCHFVSRQTKRRAHWIATNNDIKEHNYENYHSPYYLNPARSCLGSCFEECEMEVSGPSRFLKEYFK